VGVGLYSDRAALTGASPVDYIVEKCEYAFAIGVPLYVVKMGFWGFEGEHVK